MSLCFTPSPLYPSVYIGGRRSKRITDVSQTFPDLASTVSTSVPPYIHPPSVHHSPSKTGTPFPFTAHRSFQETPSPAYPTTSFSRPSTPERQENAETMSIEVAKATSKDSKGYAHNSGPPSDEDPWVPRTDYQMCLTDIPDDEGEPRDLYALQTVHTPQDKENACRELSRKQPGYSKRFA